LAPVRAGQGVRVEEVAAHGPAASSCRRFSAMAACNSR
jgi:hypothetical protein